MARRGATQKRRRSHSSSKGAKAKTISELRRSLDHISQYTDKLIASGKHDTKAMASAFAKEWHSTFGKKLDQRTAEDYVRHVASVKPKVGKTTRKNKKQRGGAQDTQLTGAPLAALTRPGVDIPYGNFLPYVNSGFDVGVPQEAILLDSGKQEGVLPYAETGSNKVGGGKRRTRRALKGGGPSLFSSLTAPFTNLWNASSMRPFIAQNPTSYQQDAMISWKGQVPSPGGQAYQHTWQPRLTGAMQAQPSVGIFDRNLLNDVSSIPATR